MKIEIGEIKELENGSVEVIINFDADTHKKLINFAFLEIIKQNLVEIERLYDENRTE